MVYELGPKAGVDNLFDFTGRIKYPPMAAGRTNKTTKNLLLCNIRSYLTYARTVLLELLCTGACVTAYTSIKKDCKYVYVKITQCDLID